MNKVKFKRSSDFDDSPTFWKEVSKMQKEHITALESKLACAVEALEKIKAMECYPWIEAGDALKRIREDK